MAGWLKRESSAVGETTAPSKDAVISSLRYTVFDTEFTSLDQRTNRLLSIGAVSMQGASIQIGGQFYRVVNPEVAVPAESVVIHKLRSEDVESGEQLAKVLDDFCAFSVQSVLVGHFVELDLKILRKEMSQTGHKLDQPVIDTARVHSWLLRHGPYSEDLAMQCEKLDLATVAKSYHLETTDAHHALSDAFLTARVWQKMLHALPQKGIANLRKLLKIAGA